VASLRETDPLSSLGGSLELVEEGLTKARVLRIRHPLDDLCIVLGIDAKIEELTRPICRLGEGLTIIQAHQEHTIATDTGYYIRPAQVREYMQFFLKGIPGVLERGLLRIGFGKTRALPFSAPASARQDLDDAFANVIAPIEARIVFILRDHLVAHRRIDITVAVEGFAKAPCDRGAHG
jgi:hypothetical protein